MRVFLILLLAAPAFGCSRDAANEPNEPAVGSTVTVVGAVTSIDDDVPVDGGVTIVVQPEHGAAVTLNFASLFTLPPPSEERTKLYDEIRKVQVGNRVRARGTRTDTGITIEEIVVLEN